MAVASLVLGIVGLVISFIPCLGSYGLLLTLPGIVLGAIGLSSAAKKNAPKGLAIAGLVCSIIGSVIAGYQCYVLNKATDAATDFANKLNESMNQASKEAENAKKAAMEIDKMAEEAQKAIDALKD